MGSPRYKLAIGVGQGRGGVFAEESEEDVSFSLIPLKWGPDTRN